jgi:hypothetical protein
MSRGDEPHSGSEAEATLVDHHYDKSIPANEEITEDDNVLSGRSLFSTTKIPNGW